MLTAATILFLMAISLGVVFGALAGTAQSVESLLAALDEESE